jgi:protein phosphatase 1B
VARAFGDFDYKSNPTLGPEQQAVTVIPEVKTHKRSPKDWYLVLACDGIWDVMSNEQVADFVVQQVDKLVAADEADILPKVGDLLLAECLNLGSKDNMSVVIVSLSGTAKKVGSAGVMEGKALRF